MTKPKITPAVLVDAWFVVAVMGKKQSASTVHGWNNLVDMVENVFYGDKPNLQDRVVVVKDLSNWSDWVPDFAVMPFHKMTQNTDNTLYVEIFRITDTKNLHKETIQ